MPCFQKPRAILRSASTSARNFLAHREGDALNGALAAAGRNFRPLRRNLRSHDNASLRLASASNISAEPPEARSDAVPIAVMTVGNRYLKLPQRHITRIRFTKLITLIATRGLCNFRL